MKYILILLFVLGCARRPNRDPYHLLIQEKTRYELKNKHPKKQIRDYRKHLGENPVPA